ncbi:MAG: hypothetical protein AAF085_12515 [Planctomycetota bacterium]
MSIELVRRLLNENATSVPELQRIMGLAESSVYRYAEQTELRFGQLLAIFNFAKSDRVRELILDELLPGTGAAVVWLPETMDANGDGDINTDDAVVHAVAAIGQLHNTLEKLTMGDIDQDKLLAMRESFQGLIEQATAGLGVIDFLVAESLRRPRRKAHPVLQTGRAVSGA